MLDQKDFECHISDMYICISVLHWNSCVIIIPRSCATVKDSMHHHNPQEWYQSLLMPWHISRTFETLSLCYDRRLLQLASYSLYWLIGGQFLLQPHLSFKIPSDWKPIWEPMARLNLSQWKCTLPPTSQHRGQSLLLLVMGGRCGATLVWGCQKFSLCI